MAPNRSNDAEHLRPAPLLSGVLDEGRSQTAAQRARRVEHADLACGFIDSATFAAANYSREWLVSGLLVANQPAIVGGPIKTLKTSFMLDMAISLVKGTPFLGHFPVPERRRVAVLSRESGADTLQETARRICTAKGCELE